MCGVPAALLPIPAPPFPRRPVQQAVNTLSRRLTLLLCLVILFRFMFYSPLPPEIDTQACSHWVVACRQRGWTGGGVAIHTHTHTFTCLVFGRRLANICFRKQIPHKCSIYNKPEVKLNQAYFLAYCLVCSLLLQAAPHSSPHPSVAHAYLPFRIYLTYFIAILLCGSLCRPKGDYTRICRGIFSFLVATSAICIWSLCR